MDLKRFGKQSYWTPFTKVTSWTPETAFDTLKVFETVPSSRRLNENKECSQEFSMQEPRNMYRELNHDECNIRFNKLKEVLFQDVKPFSDLTGTCRIESTKGCVTLQEASGISLINEVIELIRIRLKGNPNFSVHEILTNKCTSYQTKEFGLESVDQVGDNLQFLELTDIKIPEWQLRAYSEKDLIEKATSDPQTSYELQVAIEAAGKGIGQILQNVSQTVIIKLIEHKNGSYVLQQMIKLSEVVRSLVISHCTVNFEALYNDPFASRVMQLLSGYSKQFRLFLFNWLNLNLEKVVSSPAAIFLLTSCMAKTSSPEELAGLRDLMFHQGVSSKIFASRCFKRLLVSFLEHSPIETVATFVEINHIDKSVKTLLHNKFGALILFAVIKKGELRVRSRFVQLLTSDLHGLFHTKYFKLFFYKTAKYAQECNRPLHNLLTSALRGITPQSFQKVVSREDSKLYFAFLLLVTFLPTDFNFVKFASEVKCYLTSGTEMTVPLRLFKFLNYAGRKATV